MERILRDLVTENADLQSDLQTTDRQLAEKVKFASKKCGLYMIVQNYQGSRSDEGRGDYQERAAAES